MSFVSPPSRGLWVARYGGMKANDAKRLKELEAVMRCRRAAAPSGTAYLVTRCASGHGNQNSESTETDAETDCLELNCCQFA